MKRRKRSERHPAAVAAVARRRRASDGADGPELDEALRAAADQDAILEALARAVHYDRRGDPEIPTEADLIDFLSNCPGAERENADRGLTDTLGTPARWAVKRVSAVSAVSALPAPRTRPRLVVFRRAALWDTGERNTVPCGELGEADVWGHFGEDMLTVHADWRDKRDLKHPLASIVRAWLARPRPVEKRHVTHHPGRRRQQAPVESRASGCRLRPAVASRGDHGGGRARGIGRP